MNKKLYVVYWVDLDDRCLKSSLISILGVFDDKTKLEDCLKKNKNRKGYCEDERCYYIAIDEKILNHYEHKEESESEEENNETYV